MTNTKKPIVDTDFIKKIIKKNGPEPEEYDDFRKWHDGLSELNFLNHEIDSFRNNFEDALLSSKTLQGFVNVKPHGYHGDFEIIDKIYTNHISKSKEYEKWDKFYQACKAPEAVRNRKTYFKNLLKSKSDKPLNVLNLASGPCRDILEFFEENPNTDVCFDCIELDKNAIEYASGLLGKHLNKVNFINKNVFRFETEDTYDLVWSAGLFDYFDDKTFVRILSRFLKNIKTNGELVIGNFHPRNPTRAYMEFGEWFLNHRTETELVDLAMAAGVADYSRVRIEQEPLGVNLFMRIGG